jgi:hypothetical protein
MSWHLSISCEQENLLKNESLFGAIHSGQNDIWTSDILKRHLIYDGEWENSRFIKVFGK